LKTRLLIIFALILLPITTESFAGQIVSVALFVIGLGIIIRKIIERQNNLQKLKNLSLKNKKLGISIA